MEHTQTHEPTHPGYLGKLIMFAVIGAGYWMLRSALNNHTLPFPGWAIQLMLAVVGILIAGSSTLVPEERGGRASTYVGFVITGVAILLMIDGWIFHAAGR
jgi:hypothetical protein